MRCFNPRPCEGATIGMTPLGAAAMVSIHAPVKGRLSRLHQHRPKMSFNPRPCEGATWINSLYPVAGAVSIHAPVKGRRWQRGQPLANARFNPRPCEGATARAGQICRRWRSFNPRPCEGATRVGWYAHQRYLVSIHAPVKGRRFHFNQLEVGRLFQSTPL